MHVNPNPAAHASVIPAFRRLRLRQENHEFKVSLGYRERPCLKKQKGKKKISQPAAVVGPVIEGCVLTQKKDVLQYPSPLPLVTFILLVVLPSSKTHFSNMRKG
jgi:hypothetical protein